MYSEYLSQTLYGIPDFFVHTRQRNNYFYLYTKVTAKVTLLLKYEQNPRVALMEQWSVANAANAIIQQHYGGLLLLTFYNNI